MTKSQLARKFIGNAKPCFDPTCSDSKQEGPRAGVGKRLKLGHNADRKIVAHRTSAKLTGNMSAWIQKIHMYTGLLNFTMLCVFGLAGLVATAEAPDIFEADTVPTATMFAFRVPGSASDGQAAELIRQRLRPLHSVAPDVHRNGRHELVADFYSVNGLVRATLIESDGQLRVETRRNSIWRFLDNAHATTMQAAAADWAVGAWAWYIELAIWSLMLMALTGVWLALTARWPFWWTKASLVTGTLGFVIFYWIQK